MNMKKKNGFTLIEMLIVLFIITVLILLFIPQISKRAENVSGKGCEALKMTVQAQADAYFLENNAWPSMLELESNGFITNKQKTCENGKVLNIDADGQVTTS